jgi:hypothetical protein
VFPVEDIPVANTDTVNVQMNVTSQLDVLNNDADADGDALTLVSVGTATNGTATIAGNQIQYTPNGGYL